MVWLGVAALPGWQCQQGCGNVWASGISRHVCTLSLRLKLQEEVSPCVCTFLGGLVASCPAQLSWQHTSCACCVLIPHTYFP